MDVDEVVVASAEDDGALEEGSGSRVVEGNILESNEEVGINAEGSSDVDVGLTSGSLLLGKVVDWSPPKSWGDASLL